MCWVHAMHDASRLSYIHSPLSLTASVLCMSKTGDVPMVVSKRGWHAQSTLLGGIVAHGLIEQAAGGITYSIEDV